MKKLSLILCIVLIISLFVGCGSSSENGTTSGGSTANGDIFSTDAVNYIANGDAVYRIIRPKEATDAETAAGSLLFKQYRNLYASAKNITDAEDGTDVYEILLGKTNRPETTQAKNWLVENVGGRYGDYIICTIGKKIVIYGMSDGALTEAVNYFVKNHLSAPQSAGIKYTYSSEGDFTNVTVNGVSIGKFSIVRPYFNSSYLTYVELQKMVESLYQKSGFMLQIVNDTEVKEAEYEIIVGDCERPNVTKIDNRDEYSFTVSGKKIYINGGSHQATTIAVSEIIKKLDSTVAFTDADSFTGSYSQTVSNYDTTTYYTPKFWDDFDDITGDHVNANGLDTTKWKLTNEKGTAQHGYTVQRATDPEHIFVADGMFQMHPYVDDNEKAFYGGFLETDNMMRFTYGYIEYSAKIPDGPSFWSAFWLRCHDYSGSSRPEIDIVETFGNSKSFTFNMHTWPGKGEGSENVEHTALNYKYPDKTKYCPGDGLFNDAFHTYGMLWTSETVLVTCDGVPFFKYNMGDKETDAWCFGKFMKIVISLNVGSASVPDGADPLTASEEVWNNTGKYYVDWVYVYQIDDGRQRMVFNATSWYLD